MKHVEVKLPQVAFTYSLHRGHKMNR